MQTLLLILGYLIAITISADPCDHHTVLNQPWRNLTCGQNVCPGQLHCDRNLVTKWYRFSSSETLRIPETVVPSNLCSTHASGWLNGSHPTVGQGEVPRTVCFNWQNKPCQWTQKIKVKRCIDYFVYELQAPPVCSLAYCTEKFAFPTLAPWTTTMEDPNPITSSDQENNQLTLVIKLTGNSDKESMENIILQLELAIKSKFPDMELQLSFGDDAL
ncbi:pancreatic secretory granule membrane major glycoprotein GP2-like [Chiloscyllium punctatum]